MTFCSCWWGDVRYGDGEVGALKIAGAPMECGEGWPKFLSTALQKSWDCSKEPPDIRVVHLGHSVLPWVLPPANGMLVSMSVHGASVSQALPVTDEPVCNSHWKF